MEGWKGVWHQSETGPKQVRNTQEQEIIEPTPTHPHTPTHILPSRVIEYWPSSKRPAALNAITCFRISIIIATSYY